MVKTVDARKEICPKPLVMTKKAMVGLGNDETLIVIVDNQIAKENVERFLRDNHFKTETQNKSGEFYISASLTGELPEISDPLDYCAIPLKKSSGHVIVFSNDEMGKGPRDLTALLIQGFINTIKEIEPLPSALLFYGNGVLLTVEGSPLVASLKELEALGVKVMVCGTCLSFFEKKEVLKVGEISNMYSILETVTKASHVIYP